MTHQEEIVCLWWTEWALQLCLLTCAPLLQQNAKVIIFWYKEGGKKRGSYINPLISSYVFFWVCKGAMEKHHFIVYFQFSSIFDISNCYPPSLCLDISGLYPATVPLQKWGMWQRKTAKQLASSLLPTRSVNCTAVGSLGAKNLGCENIKHLLILLISERLSYHAVVLLIWLYRHFCF